ncbi:hypothetical protein PS887_05092 [Pseudomonas fluorescens]|nr:hypothetical protein PS887_05092 [Pseudomonas fluorescens]
MKSSDSLLGGFRFNDLKHRDTDPFRSVCRDYDQGTQQPVRTMRFETSPCDRLTILCELKKGSAWKINIVSWKVSRFQCIAKALPLTSGYFRCLDHHLFAHPLISFVPLCKNCHGSSRSSSLHIRFTEYSLKRIFDFPYASSLTMSPAIKVLFVCVANSARSLLAEALLCHTDQRFEAFSAGSEPSEIDLRTTQAL